MNKIAVITRTRDRVHFLNRAIQSVSGQTNQDYVHVIVNDGGDKSKVENVIDTQSDTVKARIKLFHRETSSDDKPDTIFNECVDRVASEYVVIHDDDDTWHPQFLERTISVLDEGAKGVLARTDRVYESVTGSDIKITKRKQYMPEVNAVSLYRQLLDNQLTPIAFIYSRKAYESVGKYDADLAVAGDWEFGIRFLLKYDIEYVDPGFALANYHRRENVRDDSYRSVSRDKAIVPILNTYLRKELAGNNLGPGFIMNNLYFGRKDRNALIERAVPARILKRFKAK